MALFDRAFSLFHTFSRDSINFTVFVCGIQHLGNVSVFCPNVGEVLVKRRSRCEFTLTDRIYNRKDDRGSKLQHVLKGIFFR